MQTHSYSVGETEAGIRIDIYLTEKCPDISSRTFTRKLIDNRAVLVNNKAVKPHYKVRFGDQISVDIPPVEDVHLIAQNIPLTIIYQDDDLVVADKPAGMLVHPVHGHYTDTLVNALLHHCQILSEGSEPLRPGIVHRLDRETSGVMVAAKNNRAHVRLARQFEKHKVRKKYIALAEGRIEFEEGIIEVPLGRHPRFFEKRSVSYVDAKEAVTQYRVIRRFEHHTLVALLPKTGRTHQLRVHLAHLGHPILGDDKYGVKHTFPRLALHAQSLGFVHPTRKAWVEFSVPPPQEFFTENIFHPRKHQENKE